MEFRPCIDIHNGKVKQIVGSSLKDQGDQAKENFVADYDSTYYAKLYKENHLKGGHIILLNGKDSPYYEKTRQQAMKAIQAYPGGMQVGGGITAENAEDFIQAGASHVIVTSYIFQKGEIRMDRLELLKQRVGKEHIVLDVSCKKKDGAYFIVTDRWQTMTDIKVDLELLSGLSDYCDEFLIHAVDVEGKNNGIEVDLVRSIADFDKAPITYAGGVHSFEDLELLKEIGQGKIHVTIGSALDLFGGTLSFEKVKVYCQ